MASQNEFEFIARGEKDRTLLFPCANVLTIHHLSFSGELWP